MSPKPFGFLGELRVRMIELGQDDSGESEDEKRRWTEGARLAVELPDDELQFALDAFINDLINRALKKAKPKKQSAPPSKPPV